MKNLITRQRLCTLATIIYHCAFLGGASFYVTEFQKTRDVIVQQVDRVEEQAVRLKTTGDTITSSVKSLEAELKKVKKTCSKLKF